MKTDELVRTMRTALADERDAIRRLDTEALSRATATKAFTVKAGSRTKAAGCGSTSSTWLSPLVALALLVVGRKRRA